VTRRAAEGGFTLLETLIAVALLGLTVTLLLGGVQLGTRVLDSAGRRTDQGAELAAAAEFLRSRLAEAQPVTAKPRPDAKPKVVFDGRRDALALVRLASPYQAQGGYQRLTLGLDRDPGIPALVAGAGPYREAPDGEAEAPARRSVLLADVATVEFAYFGRDAANRPPAWHQEWREQPDLPSLVRLRIAFRDGRQPPDLLVAPRLANGGK
jgi:general secretion pathway protein J